MDLAAVDALVEKGLADALFSDAAYAVWSEGRWTSRYFGRFT